MRSWRIYAVVVLCMSVLVGCTSPPAPTPENTVTLDEAKAEAQAMELEIATLIPPESVLSVDQKPKGVLLSCDGDQHSWNGSTTVTLVPGTNPEVIVKDLESRMANDDRFESTNWIGPTGKFRVQLVSTKTAANYIFGEGEGTTIVIDSGSPCFTLPEDVYPGGTF